ncbi:MAG TPA: trehalose-6-phosphate synthase [Terriglobales bacterium]|nr:trehalose-6-phosphate synthase [Terriglobales bacterium]
MARLVIMSNRIAATKDRQQKAGGLAVTLQEALKGDVLWFGWSGRVNSKPVEKPDIITEKRISYATIDLTEQEYRHFYVGFSNSTLWPLFHFRLGLVEYLREDYQGYLAVNERFAAAAAPLLKEDDLIWVHDYHLIPMARLLRQRDQAQRIGFFLHIPFTPPEVLEVLPAAADIVKDLCAYDVVGFQTEIDCRAFRACAEAYLHARVTTNGDLLIDNRVIHVIAVPAGIDAAAFARLSDASQKSKEARRLQESLVGRTLMVGVDRLDYSKGLANRFEAYSRLFERFPEHRSKISYLQVAARSREDVLRYQNLKRDLDRLSGKINGKYAEFDWVPLRYMTRSVPRRLLAGFYRSARIGLVTPLRDGMNLVAKEFVAAQPDQDPGVLILSRFAGAAASLKEALIVNPYDPDEIAEAIHLAMTMPLAERQARHAALKEVVQQHSAAAWCRGFMDQLAAA